MLTIAGMERATEPVPGDRSSTAGTAADQLTGAGVRQLLEAAVNELDAELLDFGVDQFVHDPGVCCSVTYSARCRWRSGAESIETITATTDVAGLSDGAAVLRDDDTGLEVALWRYPFDPQLPGLADVVLPERAGPTLSGIVGPLLSAEVLSYRAGRRAVLHIVGGGAEVYVKVVRPHRAQRLVAVHNALRDAGVSVPTVVASDPGRGIVILSPLAGSTLRGQLLDPAASGSDRARVARLPSAGSVAAEVQVMIDRIGRVVLDERPARRSPSDDAVTHARTIVDARPDLRGAVESTMGLVHSGADPARDSTDRTVVHGDLHDAQIMVTGKGANAGSAIGGGVVGVLDLDDVGVGRRGDDWASLIGHGVALGCHASAHGLDPRPVTAWVDALWERCGSDDSQRRSVALRAAAVTLSLATGPLRAGDAGTNGARPTVDGRADEVLLRVTAALDMAQRPMAGPGRTLENSHGFVMNRSPRRGRTDAPTPTTEES